MDAIVPCLAAHLLHVVDPATGQPLEANKLKAEVAAFMAAGEHTGLTDRFQTSLGNGCNDAAVRQHRPFGPNVCCHHEHDRIIRS